MKNLVLIGMMGCGKTTCGKLLSAKLNRPLVDTDEVPDLSGAVEYRLDKTIYHTQTQADGSTIWCQADGTPLDGAVSDRLTRALTAFTWAACIDFYADSDEVKS